MLIFLPASGESKFKTGGGAVLIGLPANGESRFRSSKSPKISSISLILNLSCVGGGGAGNAETGVCSVFTGGGGAGKLVSSCWKLTCCFLSPG